MATDLATLVSPLKANLADVVGEAVNMTDPEFKQLLVDGLNKYNDEAPQEFEENAGVLDRDADRNERRYLVLCAVYTYLTRRMIGTSEIAVSESNVNGKTDTTGIELALSKRRKEMLDADMKATLMRLTTNEVASEVAQDELLGSADVISGSTWPPLPWP